ncbi:MAG TPA: T9SS type A sorting domain-containing protein, partial [Flavobacterium sp.]|uniref:T9SS type A sorting domain-containing protein n=1 Tax=Flavobacterium sp. TaxID=239 RepID=UPI002BF97F57
QDLILDNSSNNQEFIIEVPFKITQILFDPKKNIISRYSTANMVGDNSDLIIYPNPCHDILTLKLPTDVSLDKVEVYNVLGMLIMRENKSVINISTLANGIYPLVISTSTGVIHHKLIKE